MRQEITFRRDGSKVVQKILKTDDNGVVRSEVDITLGDQSATLTDMEEKLAEAVAERDGIAAATPEAPPAPTGRPRSREVDWFVRNGRAYRREVRRLPDGTIHSVRSRDLGIHGRALEHCNERVREMTQYRDGVRDSQ